MADIKLFKLEGNLVSELEAKSIAVEKSLQSLIETHLDALLGVRFIVTEYSTGKTHGGRIDTLGIDENGCPVIIEYKRALNENVINQGLFYLDWLLDHKGEFELLVLKKFGAHEAEEIDWANPRLLCIAGDFTKYDEHAVQQINRNIELLRYRSYGEELLLFELVSAVAADAIESEDVLKKHVNKGTYKTLTECLADADEELADRYEGLKAFITGLGDDVQLKVLKYYAAFKRIKNFACVSVYTQARNLVVWVKLDPKSVVLKEGFTRDVSDIGHHGTGDLEITIRNIADFNEAKELIVKAYEIG